MINVWFDKFYFYLFDLFSVKIIHLQLLVDENRFIFHSMSSEAGLLSGSFELNCDSSHSMYIRCYFIYCGCVETS